MRYLGVIRAELFLEDQFNEFISLLLHEMAARAIKYEMETEWRQCDWSKGVDQAQAYAIAKKCLLCINESSIIKKWITTKFGEIALTPKEREPSTDLYLASS